MFAHNYKYALVSYKYSTERVLAGQAKAFKFWSRTGGAFVNNIDKAMARSLLGQAQLGLCKFSEEALVNLAGERPVAIFFLEDVFTHLTEDEQHAILLHEEGHVALGHLEVTKPGLRHELEADAYAAKQVGKKVVRSALLSLVRNFFAVTIGAGPKLSAVLTAISIAGSPSMLIRLWKLS